MAISYDINGAFTLDETAGLQTSGIADGSEDNNDNDITLAALLADAADFHAYLFTDASGLNLSTADLIGAAESAADLIQVSADGSLSTLGLTDADGDPFDGTQSSGLWTTSGHEIFLLSDAVGGIDNQVVLGMYDSDGDDVLDAVAFAVYMQPDGALDTSIDVQLFSVTMTAIGHGDTSDLDEPVDLCELVSITGTGMKTFNFDALPSGQNLFGIVGDVEDAILVIGQRPVLKPDGTYTNTSDTINTSKGGGPTTIGIDNQSFDPVGGNTNVDDGAFFTYIEDPNPSYLAGVSGGLNQNEADDADNCQFGGTKEVDGAFLKIVQVVGNGTASLTLTAFDIDTESTPTAGDARTFVQSGMGNAADQVNIDGVWVYNGSVDPANLVTTGISITILGGVATVTGLEDGHVVVWHTAADHDQVLVQAVTGSSPFDIGLFGLLQGDEASQSLAGTTFVEDDGPSLGPINEGLVEFATDATGEVTHSLNGAVGTDPDASPYTMVDWTGKAGEDGPFMISGVELLGVLENSGTQVTYYADDDGVEGFGTAGDTAYYRLSLDQDDNGGAGSYTFKVLQPPPPAFQPFDFSDLPSGQNLFGVIAANKADLDGLSLLVISGNADVKDSNGEMTNTSGTVNTSKGGGPVTIGDSNQMYDPGESAIFCYLEDANEASIAGIPGGLNQNSADDADTIGFAGTRGVDHASVEIVQVQGNALATMNIKPYDITIADGADAVDSNAEARAFAEDPLATGTAVGVETVTVKLGSSVLASVSDLDHDGIADAGAILTNGITVTFHAAGNGTYYAQVSGIGANYTIEFETDGDHDATMIENVAGKYDIGGFNLLEGLDTPDQFFEFVAQATDGDGDTALACWEVGIDGTGANDDNAVAGIQKDQPSDCVLPTLSSLAIESFDDLHSQTLVRHELHQHDYLLV